MCNQDIVKDPFYLSYALSALVNTQKELSFHKVPQFFNDF